MVVAGGEGGVDGAWAGRLGVSTCRQARPLLVQDRAKTGVRRTWDRLWSEGQRVSFVLCPGPPPTQVFRMVYGQVYGKGTVSGIKDFRLSQVTLLVSGDTSVLSSIK